MDLYVLFTSPFLSEVKSTYPDKDNHTIDAARYGLEDETTANRKARSISKTELGI